MQGASRGARLACEGVVTKDNRMAGLWAVCALLCEGGKSRRHTWENSLIEVMA
jgi:hypothetical protein